MTKETTRTTINTIGDDGEEVSTETEIEKLHGLERFSSFSTIFGIAVALITVMGTLINYHYQHERDLDVRDREIKKIFYENQSKLYMSATDTVAKIASNITPSQVDVEKFWTLYWGSLATVEDTDVDSAMVEFGKLLNRKAEQHCLQAASLLLAHCVKQSFSKTWRVDLPQPPEFPCTQDSFNSVHTCH
ncbi:MAG TPA: hypothetical protein VGG57_14055 [Stellaceae bacterium]|jgi:hypothetical protein